VKTSDEPASEARAPRGAADLELRVPFDDLVAIDERREVRLIGDVEEDLEDPDQEADDEELLEGQRIRDVRDRDRDEQRSAPEVADDQDRSPGQTVDPDTGGQGEQDERQELDRRERRDLERARIEHENRDEREREPPDLRADLADRLGRPQLQEVAVSPEAPVGQRLRIGGRR